MFYQLLKIYARLALRIYCRRVEVRGQEWLEEEGPILFAANHPNSFLDGIILTTLYEGALYSLARGDAFRKARWDRLLRRLRLLPVYRTSEGAENLTQNYATFEACRGAFAEGGAVLIFSEGGCKNEWRLRPLRKGTARLALSAWEAGLPLRVVPVGFNYSPFRVFGKNVWIEFGRPLDREAIIQAPTDGQKFRAFNGQLESELRRIVWDIPSGDTAARRARLGVAVPLFKRVVLLPFALAGFVLHAPLYYGAKAITARNFDNDHFDSVLVGLVVLAYPVYALLLSLVVLLIWGAVPALLFFVLLPFTAWACVQVKPQ